MEHVTENCQCEGKKCSKCQQLLCVGNYTKDKRLKSGLKSQCRVCSNAENKQWRQENAKYNYERKKKYNQAHSEQVKQRQRACNQKNKENVKAQRRALYAKKKQECAQPKQPVPLIEKFLSKVQQDIDTGCWLWTDRLRPNGYGMFCVTRTNIVYAHRWSYEFHKGAIPEGLVIDHLCHTRHCVNPSHLEAVSQSINVQRSKASTKRYCRHGHPFDEENTYLDPTTGRRKCRSCNRIRQQEKTIYVPLPAQTHCKRGHLFNKENTRVHNGKRHCRACHREMYRVRRSGQPRLPHDSKTHCSKGHFLTSDNTYVDSKGYQNCRICRHKYYLSHKRKTPRDKTKYTSEEWEDLKRKYNYTCLCCGKQEPEIKLTADHVIPRTREGAATIDNIQPLCVSCNSRKGKKIIDFRSKKP